MLARSEKRQTIGGRRGRGEAWFANGAAPASGITVPRTAIRTDVLDVIGAAAPMGTGHCTMHDGIELWEQQESQFLPSGTVYSLQGELAVSLRSPAANEAA